MWPAHYVVHHFWPVPLSHTPCVSVTSQNEYKTLLVRYFKKEARPTDDNRRLRLSTKEICIRKKIPTVLLKLWVHWNRRPIFSKPSVYIRWLLSNKALKPSKLLHHKDTKQPALKDKTLEFFKTNKHDPEEQKQQWRYHFIKCIISTESTLLVSDHIAKAKKPFTPVCWKKKHLSSTFRRLHVLHVASTLTKLMKWQRTVRHNC